VRTDSIEEKALGAFLEALTKPAPPESPSNAPGVVEISVWDLIASPENDLLYRERGARDSDYARLVESIRQNKVQAPLLVSQDRYIVSGHQRRRGAIDAGLETVPVVFLSVWRKDYTSDDWLGLLREHNTGREKSFAELVREKLIDIDPDKAVAQIMDDQVDRARVRLETIDISAREMKRFRISKEKQGMVDAILEVLRDLHEYLPVSLRAIHYRLLAKTFLRNSKEETRYENNLDCYKDLSSLMTRMRLAGALPWDAVCDETRPVTTWRCWRNAADFIADQSDNYLRGYARDLLQSQEQHFEIVAEKLTVQNFLKPIAARYCMPIVILRGNSGIDARYKLVERFKASGKRRLFLLCAGDCDPDGDNIVDSTLRSLRDDFGIHSVRGHRVAMTHDQADELQLPRMLEAKKTSANYRKFVTKHGREDCYELEAVEPEVLQGWLDEAIRGVLDVEAYNHEVEEQTKEAVDILAKRQAVLQMMRDARTD
jgi:hypothetical protein